MVVAVVAVIIIFVGVARAGAVRIAGVVGAAVVIVVVVISQTAFAWGSH